MRCREFFCLEFDSVRDLGGQKEDRAGQPDWQEWASVAPFCGFLSIFLDMSPGDLRVSRAYSNERSRLGILPLPRHPSRWWRILVALIIHESSRKVACDRHDRRDGRPYLAPGILVGTKMEGER